MAGRPCTCCGCRPSTLWRLDQYGALQWSANHYADYGDPTSVNTTTGSAIYGESNSWTHYAEQDESGNSYQVGAATVPIDSNTAHTQATVDTIRAYNSSGVKLWGWSYDPNGFIASGTRFGPRVARGLAVTANGTSIVHVADNRVGTAGRNVYGVNNAGSQIWNVTLAAYLWRLDGAGTNYVLMTAPEQGGSTSGTYYGATNTILDASTGSVVYVFNPDGGVGAGTPSFQATNLLSCIDRSDRIYFTHKSAQYEAAKGSATIGKLDTAASITAGTPQYTWQKFALYIRTPMAIKTDGNLLMVFGVRELNSTWSGSNPSYADTLYIAEIYEASTGNLLQILLMGGNAPGGATIPPRHELTGPHAIGNGWICYRSSIWRLFPGSTTPEVVFADWSSISQINFPTFCGRIAGDGSSSWFNAPMCSNSLTYPVIDYAYGCTGSGTYTAAVVAGVLSWVAPSVNPCPPGCYLPVPSGSPTSTSDTFTAACRSGVPCGGSKTWSNTYDTSGATQGFSNLSMWHVPPGGGTTGSCPSPCFVFGPPSRRPVTSGGGAIADTEFLTVPCE